MNPLPLKLDDDDAERVRRSHAQAIVELQGLPLVGARTLSGVELADGVATTIPHGLGRKPAIIIPGIPRGAVSAGYLVESSRDARVIVLTANGHGATITVDLAVA